MTRLALTGPVAGELSPKLIGRPDLVRYASGVRILENFVQHPTGLWEFREGFRFKGKPKVPYEAPRLEPFIYSDEQAYLLEWGHTYVRFWKDGGQIVDGGGAPIELASPYGHDELAALCFTQSADRLFVFHENRKPQQLVRNSHTSWTIADFDFRDGPYLPQNLDPAITITRSANSGSITFTVAGSTAPFAATDVGRHLRVRDVAAAPDPTLWLWCVITGFTSAQVVTATLQPGQRNFLSSSMSTPDWRLGLFSVTTKWPACATIHEQRLWVAGARIAPDRLDSSVIGDYGRFSPDTTAADGVGIAAATPQVNRIKALVPLQDIIAFSVGAEIRIGATSERGAIAPTSVSAKPVSAYGASAVQPLAIGNGVVFADRQARRIRSYVFDDSLGSYRADDLTLLADHIVGPPAQGGIIDMSAIANPVALLWLIRSDGGLAACTHARQEQVQAWHRHPLGGNALCESVAVIPGPSQDELWGAFVRTVNGTAVRTIERLEWSDPVETPPDERCHLDMALTLDITPDKTLTLSALSGDAVTATAGSAQFSAPDVGRWIFRRWSAGRDDSNEPIWKWAAGQIVAYTSPTIVTLKVGADFPFDQPVLPALGWRMSFTLLSGLTPWIGMTVTAVGNGAVLGDYAITGDTLTLPQPVGIVHVGLRYTGRVRTLPLDVPAAGPGTLQGRPQRLPRAVLRVVKSIGGRHGTKLSSLGQIVAYDANAAPQEPPEARSLDHQLVQASDWTGMPAQWVIQDAPLPFNGALIVPDVYQPMVNP